MQVAEQRATETLEGASAFLTQNRAKLGPVATCAAKVALDAYIETLIGHRKDQQDRAHQARAATQVAYAERRNLLAGHMGAIVAVARAEEDRFPALKVLRMPSKTRNITVVIAAANTIRNAAAEHRDVFVGAGLPRDFVEQLDAAIAAMLDALKDRTNKFGESVGATKGIRATIAAARKQVRILDRLVRMKLTGDEALLRNWERVKRTQKAPSSSSSSISSTSEAAPVLAPMSVVRADGVVGEVGTPSRVENAA